MDKLEYVSQLSQSQIESLIDSVDTALFDVDGVLLHNKAVIPGSDQLISKLRQLGKKVGFVTNNSVYSLSTLAKNLSAFGATEDEIINPNTALLAYLEKRNFKKDIYVVGCSLPKKLIRDEGYNVIEFKDIQPTELEETLGAVKDLALRTIAMCQNVGVVYLDTDLNSQHLEIQCAHFILNHIKGVELWSGMNDDMAPLGDNIKSVCGKYYIDAVKRWSKKEVIEMGKPGHAVIDVIESKFGISDKSRVLMFGDNVATDIALGVKGEFKTCLVLSGVWTEQQLDNWDLSEKLKPNFVASRLGEIYEIIKHM